MVDRLRERVESGEESHPGVLGTVATEMTMGVEPAERTAELAKQALAGFDAAGAGVTDWSSYNAARTLLICERYDSALAVLDRESYLVTGVSERPFLPSWAYLVLALGFAFVAWLREGR